MKLLEQFSDELDALVTKVTPGVVGVEHGRGQGAGVILTADGFVLTNRHVVRGGRRTVVRTSDGEELRAEIVGTDAPTDLGVLRVAARGLVPLSLAERHPLRVGQLVVAVGNPFRFERSVSLGVVSAIDRSLPANDTTLEGLVQTDAAINPGNSGGPLVSARGEVVGINTAIIPWAQGIGFAIPARTASWVAALLIQRGEIRRPRLGVEARAVSLRPQLAADAGQPRAVRVMGVGEGSPAERAGLNEGDLLLAIDEAPVTSVDDVQRALVASGEREVRLEVFRGGKKKRLSATPVLPPARAA